MDREKIKGLTKKYKLQIICVAGGVVLCWHRFCSPERLKAFTR